MMSGCQVVVGSCVYIQLSVISNYQNVRSVQKEQDWPKSWPKYTALQDTVVDFGVHGVLVSDSDSLCTTGDETLDPRERVVTKSKGVVQSVNKNVVVHCIKGS